VHDALTSWPYEYLHDPQAHFPSLTQFLERITIDDPLLKCHGYELPMLALRQLPALRRGRDPGDPSLLSSGAPPDAIELTQAAFEERFFRKWVFGSWPRETHSLVEYSQLQNVLHELKRQKTRHRLWSHVVEDLLSGGKTVTIGGTIYAAPAPGWDERLSIRRPVSEVARLILATKWRCDFQAAKEILVALRKEAPIATAWAAYHHYLAANPERLADIHRIVSWQYPPLLQWPPTWPLIAATSPPKDSLRDSNCPNS
jgi:hypothetical protein